MHFAASAAIASTSPISSSPPRSLGSTISDAFLAAFAAVRGLSKDESKNIAKKACSVQLHELDAIDGHVGSARAREVVGSVHVPASIDEQSAALSTNKNEDHKVSWRDVAMRGIMKKKD